MNVKRSEAPTACTLNAAAHTNRRAVWERLGQRALHERQVNARGVRLVFAPEPSVRDELLQLARLEGECCAFAEWRVEDHGDCLVLDVSARTTGVGALRAMFEGFLSAARAPTEASL